ncbi:flagellar basal-body rod protein FlgF [Hasllibacter halocynthiae]|uniref:Flagellar basal-body rod protein FlgF n=1 Tax=Hasllibacter halocynthiae TaxID=595589 RepID=A0A2T0X2N0_9RHOB|nr:flagellar hook-basal body complex protein [Hasllibacter halocynthiae]PRY93212.1 flagellar basal-body rod protein FlgF [Hasllibacter halocynthiae]
MSGYVTLARASGLMAEMQGIAHNIANASTTGYRREGAVFAEHVTALEGAPSVSQAHLHGRVTDRTQGALTGTGAPFDLAIEGEGFFQVETPGGPRLTRAGAFTPDEAGVLRTAMGHAVLDEGGAPILLPADAGPVAVAPDGTISTPLGPLGRIGLVRPEDPAAATREVGTLFRAEGAVPAEGARVVQGALEQSNVEPVTEIARMIAVQRAYEAASAFSQKEGERRREAIRTLSR